MKERLYQIGELAEKAKISVQTIRYYEKRKLLTPKSRRLSRFRLYDDDSLKTIRFIRNAKELGFNLEEISDLIKLRVYTPERNQKVIGFGTTKLEVLRGKISVLQIMEVKLKSLLAKCVANKSKKACAFIQELEEQPEKD